MATPGSPLTSTANAAMNGAKIMVYGKAGVGKTRLLGTAPNPVIISGEKGLLSLRTQNIPVYEVKTMADFKEAWRWTSTSKEARQFSTIGMDSVSEIAEVCLADMLRKTKDGRAAYGEMQTEVGNIVRNFRDLDGPNVVLIFKEEYYQDASIGTAVFMPTVPGDKFKQTLPYLTDEVFHMHTLTGQDGRSYSALRTQPDFRTVAKDRSGMLDVIERPDLTYVINKMMGRS